MNCAFLLSFCPLFVPFAIPSSESDAGEGIGLCQMDSKRSKGLSLTVTMAAQGSLHPRNSVRDQSSLSSHTGLEILALSCSCGYARRVEWRKATLFCTTRYLTEGARNVDASGTEGDKIGLS